MKRDHFKGKTVAEHLRATRAKGALASAELHGTEMAGYLSAGADAAREASLFLLLLWIIFPTQLSLLLVLAGAFALWKAGRSALLGWARLERLHRLIEEERWEIEHHREQEREELTALYAAKGLSGKLLEETVSVLMADDNRLLRVMLEEEMGLTLEVYDHPLKESLGAILGVGGATALFIAGYFLSPFGPFIATGVSVLSATWMAASLEKNRRLEAVIWTLALVAFVAGATSVAKIWI